MKKVNLLCVIDDDKVYTYLIKRIIEAADVADNLVFFENGLDALKYFDRHKEQADKLPELILLDINMPILDGWQFMDAYSKIRSVFPKPVSLYMTSSSTDEEDYHRAQSTEHVLDLLRKPVSVNILKSLVETL
ncbi:response regulator [Dyadobacter psychrotolerans]|uniref:Response regulator n=1 Tax=Dyadobacter psychrotolerans TaxID=2541721 RepID=A0A4R5DFJ0_9BACT|nr:response regulator [Dyadobacter psychrotolerans]TDE10534.1 response regulator [Dyadobacter psychrotolerans]